MRLRKKGQLSLLAKWIIIIVLIITLTILMTSNMFPGIKAAFMSLF